MPLSLVYYYTIEKVKSQVKKGDFRKSGVAVVQGSPKPFYPYPA
jgi:hypothetical protein